MAKKTVKRLVCTALGLVLAVSMMALPALAAGADHKGYVVTFRPGKEASIASEYVDGLKAAGYECQVSKATGSVSVLVPVGETLPSAPGREQFLLPNGRYQLLDPAPGYTPGAPATQSFDGVATYGMKRQGQDYAYQVRYLDRETGAEVAPAVQGNASADQLVFYAPVVANYTAQTTSQQLLVTQEGPNELTFYYTLNSVTNVTTEIIDGGTTTRVEQVIITAPGGGGAGGGAGDGADEDLGEVINPDDVPLAGGAQPPAPSEGEAEEEIIPDEETPTTQAPAQGGQGAGLGQRLMLGAAGLALIVGLLLLVSALLRRRQRTGEER